MLTESVISLKLGNLILRPLDEEKDMDLLSQWRNDLTYLALWLPQRYPVSKEEFKAEFERFQRTIEHIRLIIIKDGETVGTVYSYNCNLTHGWVYIATYLRPEFRKKGIGPKAWALFIEYLFDNFPFRKVYCDVYGFNNLSLSTLKSGGLEVQAQLPKHIFWQGSYYDMYTMALTRENLSIVKSRLGGWRKHRETTKDRTITLEKGGENNIPGGLDCPTCGRPFSCSIHCPTCGRPIFLFEDGCPTCNGTGISHNIRGSRDRPYDLYEISGKRR